MSLIVTAMLIGAPAAAALQPGVHVDPHSPSGTEYSFPLGSTRQQLGGRPSAGASAGSGPLFGVGLRSVAGHRRAAARSRAPTEGRSDARAHSGHGSGSHRAFASLRRQQNEAIAALDHTGSSHDALELTAAVLLLGAAAGVALSLLARRRRSHHR